MRKWQIANSRPLTVAWPQSSSAFTRPWAGNQLQTQSSVIWAVGQTSRTYCSHLPSAHTFPFHCLSNAMHSIGQSINHMSVRPSVQLLLSYLHSTFPFLLLFLPLLFPLPIFLPLSLLHPVFLPLPLSLALSSSPFPFPSFFSSSFPSTSPSLYLPFSLLFPFPFLFPFLFSFPFSFPFPLLFPFSLFLSLPLSISLLLPITEVLWCASARGQSQLPSDPLAVGSDLVSPVRCVHDLGIFINADLTMRTQVTQTCSKCFAALRQLRSICWSVSNDVMQSLIVALVFSRLDYGSATLAGLPKQLMDRLQSVQNAAARLIFKACRRDHI